MEHACNDHIFDLTMCGLIGSITEIMKKLIIASIFGWFITSIGILSLISHFSKHTWMRCWFNDNVGMALNASIAVTLIGVCITILASK